MSVRSSEMVNKPILNKKSKKNIQSQRMRRLPIRKRKKEK